MNTRFLARLERLIDIRIRHREAVVLHGTLEHDEVSRLAREIEQRQTALMQELRTLDDGTAASILHALTGRIHDAPIDLASAVSDAAIATFGLLVRENLDSATLAFLTCGVTRRGFLQRFAAEDPPPSRNVH